jgi:DNA-binding GntR family transcriptional regulator
MLPVACRVASRTGLGAGRSEVAIRQPVRAGWRLYDPPSMHARLKQVEVVRTLEEHTYGSLREAISTGVVRPGYRLSADQLAKDLGVSRMPVVQALRRLASEGFVTAEPHKPVTVAAPTPAQIRERYLVIVALERLCATEAFGRDVDGLVESLRARLAEQRAGTRTPSDEDMHDRAFHAALWDAGGLPNVGSMLRTLWDRGGYYRSLLFARGDHRDARIAEHAAILSAAEAVDLDGVLRALEEHRSRGMVRMLEIMAERN